MNGRQKHLPKLPLCTTKSTKNKNKIIKIIFWKNKHKKKRYRNLIEKNKVSNTKIEKMKKKIDTPFR